MFLLPGGGNSCAPWGNGCVSKEMFLLLGVRDACVPKKDVCALTREMFVLP